MYFQKHIWLFSANQVFKFCFRAQENARSFFPLKKVLKTQGYSSMGLELKALDVAIGEARLKTLVVTKNLVRK